MRYEIKELNVGGILDQAITLVKNHFKLLLLITLVLMVPFGIIGGLLASSAASAFDPRNAPPPGAGGQAVLASMSWILVILLINLLIIYPLTNGAMIHALASEYLEKPTSLGSAYSRAFQVLLPLIGTGILTYLAISGGMLLCFVPGIIFAIFFSLTTQIVVIEGTAGFAALTRGRKLIKGNVGAAFVLGFLLFVIQMGLSFLNQLIPQQHLAVVTGALLQSVLFIFTSAAWVVFYFSCRCKHENFDLAMLAEAVGHEEPGALGENPAS